ncbi:hypothetical protein ISS37_00790 [candidate division KSB1 bacterium]|nr:hypothetical protein [candidate division KSB1 bacterium]
MEILYKYLGVILLFLLILFRFFMKKGQGGKKLPAGRPLEEKPLEEEPLEERPLGEKLPMEKPLNELFGMMRKKNRCDICGVEDDTRFLKGQELCPYCYQRERNN